MFSFLGGGGGGVIRGGVIGTTPNPKPGRPGAEFFLAITCPAWSNLPETKPPLVWLSGVIEAHKPPWELYYNR